MNTYLREYERAYITFFLRVFAEDRLLGYLLEVSRDGFMLMSENRLDTVKIYDLKIKLPFTREWNSIDKKKRIISFKAECLRSTQDPENSNFYLSGFKYTDLGKEENEIIGKIIKEYSIK